MRPGSVGLDQVSSGKKRIIGLHRPAGVERDPHDFYATCPTAVPPLLALLGWSSGGKLIWENSCGQGHLASILSLYGHTVIATDLIYRGYGIGGVDFLQEQPLFDTIKYDGIIMNPPYRKAQEFVVKALNLAPVVCAFLRLSFLESETRIPFFRDYPPKYVAVFSKRVKSSKNAKFDPNEKSTVCYAWFIWERGYQGPPIVKWIL